ncbi:MAG: riboflavin biosynthesis protein RibF [Candidatus Zixiibacteriota bacterium]
MQVFQTIEEASALVSSGSVVTIGNYDGIHRAHQAIISDLASRARAKGQKSILVTFDPHPSLTIAPAKATKLLTTTGEKIRLLREGGLLDAVLVLHFDEALAKVSATDFLVRYLLAGLRMSTLVVGYNHAFGHKREGDIKFMKAKAPEYGFEIVALEPVLFEAEVVNSSRIRGLMASGAFAEAITLLGHPFELSGKVVHGKGLGLKMGFPTVNIKLPKEKIVPKPGVYAAYSLIGSDKRAGMMYIGEIAQPEFDLEFNVFDFEGDLYGQTVGVFPSAFIRPPLRFDSERELIAQIGRDEEMIRSVYDIRLCKE